MIDETNPAGRLYNIISRASNMADQHTAKVVWSKVLDCEEDVSDSDLTVRIVEVYNLSKEVQILLKVIPDLNHELYLASFPKLEKAIFPLNLSSNWRGQKSILSEEVVTRLQFCAQVLQDKYSEETLDTGELEEISELVRDLFKLIEASNIPAVLRLALLEEASKIEKSISMYRIKGAKGVKESLQSLLGSVIVNREDLELIASENEDVLNRLGTLIDKLDSFTARALKLKRILSGPLTYLLKYLSDPEEEVDEDSLDV